MEQLFTNSDYLLKRRSERLPPINVEVSVEERVPLPAVAASWCLLRVLCACRGFRLPFRVEEARPVFDTFLSKTAADIVMLRRNS